MLQTVSTDYRQPVWRVLFELSRGSVLLLAGARYFAPTVVTRHQGTPLVTVQNRYILKRRVLIQRLPFRLLLGAPAVIVELNPRILTTWLVLVARRLRRRRTVLWGHAFSRQSSIIVEWVRQVMRQLGDTIVVYTESERELLARRMPGKDIVVAPNAVFAQTEMVPRMSSGAPYDFIYVGRLVTEKRPDLLVRAYLSVIDMLPTGSRLLMVGDGPLRELLERQVAEAGATERVRFYGHISDIRELRSLYATALASVSPGYVGLSIIQSLGFGVPMIIADEEQHSPEIEAADPGFNCMFFTAGSAASLADTLVAVSHDPAPWLQDAEAISQACRRRYSVEAMAERLLDACQPPASRSPAPSRGHAGA